MRTAAGLALVIAHCSWRWQAAAAVAAAETASAGSAASGVVMCAGSGNTTACPPKTATCCHHNFSKTTMGCCPYPNAVCCAGSYGLCCPAGTTCKSTGTYSGLCLKIKHGIGVRATPLAPSPMAPNRRGARLQLAHAHTHARTRARGRKSLPGTPLRTHWHHGACATPRRPEAAGALIIAGQA